MAETMEEALASLDARGGPKLRWFFSLALLTDPIFRIHFVDGNEVVEQWIDKQERWNFVGLLRDNEWAQREQENHRGPKLGEKAFARWADPDYEEKLAQVRELADFFENAKRAE